MRGVDVGGMACLQNSFDAAWPPLGAQDVSLAPQLRVLKWDPGSLPSCARNGSSVLYVHLSGLFRSMANHTENLVEFLDASASCWFVVLYTTHIAERTNPWWCFAKVDTEGGKRKRQCLSAAAAAVNRTVLSQIPAAVAPLARAERGGVAFAVASRSSEAAMETDTLVLQNFAAASALARCTLAHHGVLPRASDVILHSRPDVLYSRAVDFERLATLGHRAAASARPLLLLLRHGTSRSFGGIGGNDPSEVAWLSTRAALDMLCTEGASCLGARSEKQMRLRHRGCQGHAYLSLFVHAATRLGVLAFFVDTGWEVRAPRLCRAVQCASSARAPHSCSRASVRTPGRGCARAHLASLECTHP